MQRGPPPRAHQLRALERDHRALALGDRSSPVRNDVPRDRREIPCAAARAASPRCAGTTGSTPGRIATKLQPDAHCSRSCSVRRSPPQKTGSSGMPHAASAAKMFGRSWIVVSPFRQCSTGSRSGPMKCGGNTTHSSRSTCVKIMSRWIAVVLLRHHDDDDVAHLGLARTAIDASWSIAAGLDRSLKPMHDEVAAQRMDVAALERVVHPPLRRAVVQNAGVRAAPGGA